MFIIRIFPFLKNEMYLLFMGIYNDANLIIGWELSIKELKKWRIDLEYEECCYSSGDICECDIDNLCKEKHFPSNFTLIKCSPYYDCSVTEQSIFLCYYNGKIGGGSNIKLSDIEKILEEKESFRAAGIFAKRMGGEGDAIVMAIPHIW